MNEAVAVQAIHTVTFCWAISRLWAPRTAWRPRRLDYPAGVVAGVSWGVMVVSSIPDLGDTAQQASESPLTLLLSTLGMIAGYGVLFWVSVRVRVWVSADA